MGGSTSTTQGSTNNASNNAMNKQTQAVAGGGGGNVNTTIPKNTNTVSTTGNDAISEKQERRREGYNGQGPGTSEAATTARDYGDGYHDSEGNVYRRDSVTGFEFRKIAKDYTFEKQLGEGHYGVVRLGMNKKTKEKVAIKSILKKKVKRIEILKREIDVMKELNHPNIIKLLDVYEDEAYLHLVMELCKGGELFERIIKAGSLSELQAAQIMHQVLDALAYCHKKHIAHRDLKPENFLFTTDAPDAPLKIIDFGLSNFFETEKDKFMKTRVGTPYYLAPEVLDRHFDEKCDLWSAGVIFYILLCGYPPFNGPSDKDIFFAIKRGKFTFPEEEWSGISQEAKDMIKSLLQMDPKRRPSAEEALKHPWITSRLKISSNAGASIDPSKAKAQPSASVSGSTPPRQAVGTPGVGMLPQNAIESLKKFAALSKLKRKAFGLISKQLSGDDIEELGYHFRSIDQDNNKVITPKELVEAIGFHATSEEIKDIFAALDANGDGVINYEEFLNAASVRREYLKEERIKKAFDIFDKRGTGVVSVREFEVSVNCFAFLVNCMFTLIILCAS